MKDTHGRRTRRKEGRKKEESPKVTGARSSRETHGPWTMGVEEDRVLGLSMGGENTAARGS